MLQNFALAISILTTGAAADGWTHLSDRHHLWQMPMQTSCLLDGANIPINWSQLQAGTYGAMKLFMDDHPKNCYGKVECYGSK